jgi:hypothetical protein
MTGCIAELPCLHPSWQTSWMKTGCACNTRKQSLISLLSCQCETDVWEREGKSELRQHAGRVSKYTTKRPDRHVLALRFWQSTQRGRQRDALRDSGRCKFPRPPFHRLSALATPTCIACISQPISHLSLRQHPMAYLKVGGGHERDPGLVCRLM